ETTGDESLILLNELFQLPETTDPLQWIQDRHSDAAALKTLRYVLTQIRPPDSLWDRQTMQVHRPDVRLRPKEHGGTLHEMALGQSAFVLTLRIRIPRKLFQTPGLRGITWEGVESVVDDLGHHYLVYRVQESLYKFLRRYIVVRLLCYPAIAATATELTLKSDVASFVIRHIQSEEPHRESKVTRSFVHLGDLTWSMSLPR
ncbi:MAG: hypothetical protein GWO38_13670, partial [Phycisphaerae bacterium]|nr:hypothetical protein [Phycisphaerae bacterium]NIX28641.1 hypothetical protein [Phycisphaerae bacterium]